MSTSKLNEWTQILATIAVFFGLLAVAYELRQNSHYAFAEHSRGAYNQWMQIAYLEIESDIYESLVRSIENPNELTDKDKFKLSAWLMLHMAQAAYSDDTFQIGIASQDAALSEEEARYYFSTEFSRQWFEKNMWMGEKPAETIRRVIETTPIARCKEEVFEYLSAEC